MDLSGLIFGDRVIEYVGTIKVRDAKNKLAMNLVFGPPAPSGFFSWFGHGKLPSDFVVGDIVQATSEDLEPQKGDKVLSSIGGTWLGTVEWDGKTYWDVRESTVKHTPLPVDNPLPSDSRFRQDLIKLAESDVEAAQM